jgi:hypothetical protein
MRATHPLDRLQRDRGTDVVGVELAEEALRLADLPAARRRNVIVLGHVSSGGRSSIWYRPLVVTPPEEVKPMNAVVTWVLPLPVTAVRLP